MDKTMDEIQKAFQEAKSCVVLPGFELVLVSSDNYGKAMDFIRDHFITTELINSLYRVEWTEELKEMCFQSLKHNLSLMFLDEKSGETVALIRTGIQDKHFYEDIDNIQSKSLKGFMYFEKICDDKADYFGHYETDMAFHIETLAVAENYRRKGLATNIFKAAFNMLCELENDIVYIKVEGSSKYSKKIFENSGFETLSEVMIGSDHFPDIDFKSLDDKEVSQKNYGFKYVKPMHI